MAIQPISNINASLAGNSTLATKTSDATPFKSLFDAAVKTLDETNDLQKTADQMSIDFAVGKIDNIADVMIAQEKASVALQYTVQLRNKLLDAYNEIMRMQI